MDGVSIRKFNTLQVLPPEDELEVRGRGLYWGTRDGAEKW